MHAPPLQVEHQALSSKSPNIWMTNRIIGRKMGRNLSEDLFFCSSPVLGEYMGRILSVTISNFDLCFSQIF